MRVGEVQLINDKKYVIISVIFRGKVSVHLEPLSIASDKVLTDYNSRIGQPYNQDFIIGEEVKDANSICFYIGSQENLDGLSRNQYLHGIVYPIENIPF